MIRTKLILICSLIALTAVFGCGKTMQQVSEPGSGSIASMGVQEQQAFLVKLDNVEQSVIQLKTMIADLKKGVIGVANALETHCVSLGGAAGALNEEDVAALEASNAVARLNAVIADINAVLADPDLATLLTSAQLASVQANLTAAVQDELQPTVEKVNPVPVYAIGDTGPAGGIIFDVDAADGVDNYPGDYLEAALADAPAPGYMNWYSAISYCDTLEQGGKDDWFMPSKDQLTLLYQQQDVVGGFVSNYYWSSSEYDADGELYAWIRGFGDGQMVPNNKLEFNWVRAARAF